jgi:NAD(P)-dependent dehydrogenase (short-subunit alcohol dehydrogenase family)
LLKDKVTIVTGACRGFGFEISKEFAERGAAVIMCSRIRASADKSASQIKAKTYPEGRDVRISDSLAEFAHHMTKRHEHIDILVNNADYPFDRKIWNKRFHEVAEEDFERVIEAHLKRTYKPWQALIPLMIKKMAAAAEAEE